MGSEQLTLPFFSYVPDFSSAVKLVQKIPLPLVCTDTRNTKLVKAETVPETCYREIPDGQYITSEAARIYIIYIFY